MFPINHGVVSQVGGNVATYTVTTTGAHTHTINNLTVSAATTVDWGDGSDNTYTGTGARTHDYATAGTWQVTISDFENVTDLRIFNQAATVSGDLSGWVLPTNMTQLQLYGNSFTGDLSGWALPTSMTLLYLHGNSFTGDLSGWALPTSMTQLYLFNNSFTGDLSGWALPTSMTHLYLYGNSFTGDLSGWALPTSMTILYLSGNSFTGDLSGWVLPTSMTQLYLHGNSFTGDLSGWVLPTSMTLLWLHGNSFTGDLSGWALPTSMTQLYLYDNSFTGGPTPPTNSALGGYQIYSNALPQAAIDAILHGFYSAAATRTATGGTINVGGTNAAPSGTFQAAASCPVTGSTPGKEVAYELLNDTCDAFANHWATVTFTA